MTKSPQQQQHWLAEQVLNWSGVPVAHVRSTVFLETPFFSSMAASSIAKDGTIRLPFGSARTSPISASDVARVISTILEDPTCHRGKVYELTGPRSEDMNEMAKEYATALNRPVKYVNTPYDKWLKEELMPAGLPQYVFYHVSTMAKLHAENRYDRLTSDVQKLTGKPSMSASGNIFHCCSQGLDNTRTSSEFSHLATIKLLLTSWLELYCSCRAGAIPSSSPSRSMMS
jgi:NAD(P)H dehydrogenase (quinone)